MITNYSEIR